MRSESRETPGGNVEGVDAINNADTRLDRNITVGGSG
jgi:hypothetical protein